MKKIFLAFVLLLSFLGMEAKKPIKAKEIKAPIDTTITTDSINEVAAYLKEVDAWVNTCGLQGQALAVRGKGLGQDVVNRFKVLPAPVTPEAVKSWFDEIELIFGGLSGVVGMILTFVFSLFKKDPEAAITQVQKVINSIRTRYLVLGSSLVVTIVGLFYMGKDGLTLADGLKAAGLFGSTLIGSLGLQNLLAMFGIKWFEAKKV